MVRRRSWSVVSLVGVAWVLTLGLAPAGAQEKAPAPDATVSENQDAQALRKRVEAFWEAKLKEDYAAEFAFVEPRIRNRMKLSGYMQGRGWVDYTEFKVEGVKVDGLHGEATVRFVALVRPPVPQAATREPKPRTFQATERWVKVGEEWFRRHDQEAVKDPPERK